MTALAFQLESAHGGTGLQGMADRLTAVRASLVIRSVPGQGTLVTGRLPLQRRELPAQGHVATRPRAGAPA